MDTPNPIPTPGRIVHHWRESLTKAPIPAMVISWDPEKQQAVLCIFSHLGPSVRNDVPYAKDPTGKDCWTWPARPKETK